MKAPLIRPFAFASAAVFALALARAQYASSVVNYTAGSGATAGYDNPATVLGEPSRVTPGQFGGPVDPFAPPYLNSQLVSLGAGGSLTVQFSSPIAHDPAHAYGFDFQIFGNSGFIVTNALDENFNFIGTPATDGSLFGSGATTRVSVSADGQTFFTLNPALAPAVDTMFPTDGNGDFGKPVDPSLKGSNFAGLTLEGVRGFYAGSGGGAGFNLGWAQDGSGQAVVLSGVSYVRIEVLNGKADIDGFSAVTAVPEPATWSLLALGLGSLVMKCRR